ncbi:MAG: hypothetical protein IPJ41_00910 [Phycisphaerales bacterium]|nr:hypothetical protein [Phycisphaerales bacterium]
MTEQAAAKPGFIAGLTGLQRLLLALAGALSLSGAGLWGYAATTSPERPATISTEQGAQGAASGLAPQGFADESAAGTPAADSRTSSGAEQSPLQTYSPTIFRLGFAFFLGFAIAYAIRAALKVVLIVVGAVLLLLVGLQMAGLIAVNWEAMRGLYDGSTSWLGQQTQSLSAFLSGYIPSGGTALAGFGVGLMKRH